MAESSYQDYAYDQLREAIVFCRLAPGQKLSAKTLEEMLNVGRTPIRESLVRLSELKLVYTVPQSGTYVSKIDMRTAENARFMREHLERSVTIKCCSCIDEAGKEMLRDVISREEDSVCAHDAEDFFTLDNLFHKTLFQIAGRAQVWEWINTCDIDLDRYRWLRTQVDTLEWDVIMDQHRQIYQAVCDGDTDAAGYISAAHMHLMITERETVCSRFAEYFAPESLEASPE